MKNKKRFGLVSIILGLCIAVASFTGLVAFADGEASTPNYVAKANNEDLVFFKNPVDYFTVDEKEIDVKKIDSVTVSHKTDGALVDGEGYIYKDGTITYGRTGEHTVTVVFKTDAENVTVSATATVNVVATASAPAYVIDSQGVKDLSEKMTADASALDDDKTSLKIDDQIWTFVSSNVYSSSHYLTKLYVAKPKNDFSAVDTKWSKPGVLSSITLSTTGTYSFYVELKDPSGGEIVVDKDEYVQKIDGWYDDNDTEDESDDTLIVPIFTFDYEEDVKFDPTITVKANAIKDQEYTQAKITSNGSRNVVTLLYNPSANAKNPADDLTGWIEAENGKHAEFGDLTKTSTVFTPLMKDCSYAFKLVAKGGVNDLEEKVVYSDAIVVSREVQQQVLVNVAFRNFLKNNWLSLVFLGIALLCVVGIIILAFYKPKDETDKPAPKKAKIEDEEVVETPEVEEAVEEVAEEAPVEEVVDAPAEDATEEVVEAPVEETVAPAEEVEETPEVVEAPVEEVVAPAEEEVAPAKDKTDGENA
ncbi:MAG: hypothetical protein IJY84_04860 [Clostridia bacterium]|nr:hypothetical protein [Clostridia bacterium]